MSPSPIQLFIILAIALLLFGKRLPEIMRSMGRSVTEFKKGVAGVEDEVDSATKMARKKVSKDDDDDESEE